MPEPRPALVVISTTAGSTEVMTDSYCCWSCVAPPDESEVVGRVEPVDAGPGRVLGPAPRPLVHPESPTASSAATSATAGQRRPHRSRPLIAHLRMPSAPRITPNASPSVPTRTGP